MGKIVKDVLFGILIIVVITIFEFIVTLPFGEPSEINQQGIAIFINRELLLTALPAALATYLFAKLVKTISKYEALRRSIIWTIIVFMNYFIIDFGNYRLVFKTVGIYVLLICVFAGPLLYTQIKHLE